MNESQDTSAIKRATAELEREVNSFSEPHLSDLGNSKRLVLRYGAEIRFVPSWGWCIWDGRRWKRDAVSEVYQMAKETILNLHFTASFLEDDEERRRLIQHALRSEAAIRVSSMIFLAQSERKVFAEPGDFDRDPLLFNVSNGTVDLRTGQLRAHQREDLITKLSPVIYDPEATRPRWEGFLMEVFDNHTALVNFVHRAAGYALTGITREQCFFLLHGSGSNGKSTFLETLKTLLGEYGATADFSTFTVQGREGIRNDIASLMGKRFVTSVEVEEGKKLSETLLKQLTGSDTIAARFLHKEFFEFRPIFKIWMAANSKPIIKSGGHSIWRRVRLIPFDVTFPDEQQDKGLFEKFVAELPGVLNWIVGGCLLWQLNGLNPPEEVKVATGQYREEMDTIGIFLKECCMTGEGEVSAGNLYKVYKDWAGRGAVSQRKFGDTLSELGFERRVLSGRILYKGLSLIEEGDSR